MNWTGGRRARHNSNASLRLQKQYFARVRMARGSAQATGKLIRSSSPIELMESVRKRARGGTSKEHAKTVSSFGTSTLQGKSDRPVWERGAFMIKQGKKQSDNNEGDLERGDKIKLFALESGGSPITACTKRKNLEKVKRLLLEKEDWLGTRSTIILSEEEEEEAYSHLKFSSGKELLYEEQHISGYRDDPTVLEGEDIGELPKLFDSGIDQMCTHINHDRIYQPPHFRVDSQSTYIQVGNARISNRRTTYKNITSPSQSLPDTVQENLVNDIDIATSESMLLNLEDPIVLGDCRKGVDTLSVFKAGEAEDGFDLESVLTWSSSNYIGKCHPHESPIVNIEYSVENTRQQGSLMCPLASSPPLPQDPNGTEGVETPVTLLPSKYMTDGYEENPVEQQNTLSPQLKAPSSLDACATSVAESGHSEDSQWIDMIANEYYWHGITDKNDLVVTKSSDVLFDGVLFAKVPTDQDIPLRKLENYTASGEIEKPGREDSLLVPKRKNDLQADAMEKNIQLALDSPMKMQRGIGLTTPTVKIDLSDDSAWKDFVHKPPMKEIWGDEYEGKHVSHDTNERNWYIFLEDFEGQALLPLRKRLQAITEAPKESDIAASNSGWVSLYTHSNEATIGSLLSPTTSTGVNYVDPGSSVVYNDPPSPIRLGVTDSYSSLAAHASSCTGVTAPISSSGSVRSVESESTGGTKSASSSPRASSASRNRMQIARTREERGIKDVMISGNKSGHPEHMAIASYEKKITRFKNIFESVRDSGAREDIDDIEEW